MYRKIIVPIDLAHIGRLEKALGTAAKLAAAFDAEICYVSVGASFPSRGYDPHSFETKLQEFAKGQAARHGLKTTSHAIITLDPAADLDRTLLKEIEATGCDLVIMGSHTPGMAEYFISSNAGYIASHSKVSVMVVR